MVFKNLIFVNYIMKLALQIKMQVVRKLTHLDNKSAAIKRVFIYFYRETCRFCVQTCKIFGADIFSVGTKFQGNT
jgi:hypothetical protein